MTCAEQIRVLTWRESLRAISATLGANTNKLYAMGLRHRVRRSTLADANTLRDCRIWSDVTALLMCCVNDLTGFNRYRLCLTYKTSNRIARLLPYIFEHISQTDEWGLGEIQEGDSRVNHSVFGHRFILPSKILVQTCDASYSLHHVILELAVRHLLPGILYSIDQKRE